MTPTPTEKDAMALAVLERLTDQFGREHGTFGNDDHTLWNAATEARAHLAARLGELEAGWASEKEAYDGLADKYEEMERRATCAEAELAAVREDAEQGREIAAAFLPVMEAMRPLVLNLERLKDAAVDAARGWVK